MMLSFYLKKALTSALANEGETRYLGAGSGPLLLMGDGKLALLARASAKQLEIDARNGSLPANAGSDHESFARRGVDTVFFMRDYNLLHTPQDTIDQINQTYLEEAGRVAQRVLERLETTGKQTQGAVAE